MDHQPAQRPPAVAPPVYQPPWNGKTNGFAIACLSLALLGCTGLPSVVFGVIAIRQTRRNGDRRGRFYAFAGLAVCGLWAIALTIAVVVAVAGNIAKGPDRDASGAVRGERSIRLTELRAGDCLQDLKSDTGNYADVVPCTTAHTTEVFATFTLPDGEWPGDVQIKKTAQDGCGKRYPGYAGVKLDEKSDTVLAAPPEELGWSSERDVLCLVHHLRGTTTTSVRR